MVIPHIMGIAVWSPKLYTEGKHAGISVKGLEFCKRMADKFGMHPYNFKLDDNLYFDKNPLLK